MPKILVLDNLSEEGVDVFRQTKGFEVDVKPAQKPDELAAIIGAYDGLVVRSATKVTPEVLAHAKNLKIIGRAGVGTDNIDCDAATRHGVVVMNTPGGNTISTCEHTFALMFALCRSIPRAHRSMDEGKWERKGFMGAELFGKTLGILGVGRIGSAVARRAQAFEMKVIAFDPLLNKIKADALGVELVSLDAIIERSDIITIHAPKSEKTTNLLGEKEFRRMKSTCRIINCARGGIVNETELAQALRDKVIAGAGLDVFSSEPFENNPFIGLDNVVMTPHLAASTDEAQVTVAVDVAKQMAAFFTTGAIANAVNVPSIDGDTNNALRPVLYLGERLGRFVAMYLGGRFSSIDIEYRGDLKVTDTYPITSHVLKGFLAPMVEMVNVVNAPYLLAEHGIVCSEKRYALSSDYSFEIRVTVTTDKESHCVSGTLFSKNDPRICSIDGFRVDARPEGYMLVCLNEDKPLIIGRVGTIIGTAGVNIANMVLGRNKAGGHAFTILNLDSPLSEEVMAEIRGVPHIIEVRLVHFP